MSDREAARILAREFGPFYFLVWRESREWYTPSVERIAEQSGLSVEAATWLLGRLRDRVRELSEPKGE